MLSRTCSYQKISCSKSGVYLEFCFYLGAGTDPCELPPDNGLVTPSGSSLYRYSCKKVMLFQNISVDVVISNSFRWYFDIAAERCIQFSYGGTGGNANNFASENDCMQTCGIGEFYLNQFCRWQRMCAFIWYDCVNSTVSKVTGQKKFIRATVVESDVIYIKMFCVFNYGAHKLPLVYLFA